MSTHWREEDRRWRAEDREWRVEDVEYREQEREWFLQEAAMRESERQWRAEDVEQRHVENARYVWSRFVEKNRRDVEEKSEQLKAISNVSALFAGFAVVTLTQFNFQYSDTHLYLVAIYGILTATTVGLMTLSMVTCTLILGSILKNGKNYVNEDAEEDFMFRCKDFVEGYAVGQKPPAPRRTFEAFWDYRCEEDWRRAFSFFTWELVKTFDNLAANRTGSEEFCSVTRSSAHSPSWPASFRSGACMPPRWIKFFYSTVTAACFMGIVCVAVLVWGWQQWSWGSYLTASPVMLVDAEMRLQRQMSLVHPQGLPFDWHMNPSSTRLDNLDN
eukprot:SM000006S19511  [mRNA]  locus=s6:1207303:1210332:+ [translate_table: standard]